MFPLVLFVVVVVLLVTMAMQEPFMVKTVEGNTDLTLEADSGESLLVKDIQVYNPASDYCEVSVEKTLAGYFRIGGTLGNHLAVPPADHIKMTLLQFLFERGLWRGIPIADGQTLLIEGVAQAGAIQKVFYEKHETGDMTKEMPNGSKADTYDYINYGRLSTFADADNLFDVQQTLKEFPPFPFAAVVPSNKEITILGILFSDIYKGDTGQANQQITKYLKFIKERTTLWDDDKVGYPVIGLTRAVDVTDVGLGQSDFGNYNDIDSRKPWIYPQPAVYVGGEELSLYLTTSVEAGVANFVATDVEIGLLTRVVSLE